MDGVGRNMELMQGSESTSNKMAALLSLCNNPTPAPKKVSCPVCTLYLREGMTLQDHLLTHPKEQIISALVNATTLPSPAVQEPPRPPTPPTSSPPLPMVTSLPLPTSPSTPFPSQGMCQPYPVGLPYAAMYLCAGRGLPPGVPMLPMPSRGATVTPITANVEEVMDESLPEAENAESETENVENVGNEAESLGSPVPSPVRKEEVQIDEEVPPGGDCLVEINGTHFLVPMDLLAGKACVNDSVNEAQKTLEQGQDLPQETEHYVVPEDINTYEYNNESDVNEDVRRDSEDAWAPLANVDIYGSGCWTSPSPTSIANMSPPRPPSEAPSSPNSSILEMEVRQHASDPLTSEHSYDLPRPVAPRVPDESNIPAAVTRRRKRKTAATTRRRSLRRKAEMSPAEKEEAVVDEVAMVLPAPSLSQLVAQPEEMSMAEIKNVSLLSSDISSIERAVTPPSVEVSSKCVGRQQKPYECLECGACFRRKAGLKLHSMRHSGERPHRCSFCQKGFLTRQKLQEHVNGHTGEAPLRCPVCPKTFRRYSNLIQHRSTHSMPAAKITPTPPGSGGGGGRGPVASSSSTTRRQRDFLCDVCHEVFHSLRKLAWHKEVHSRKPKVCSHCGECFVHGSSLTRHVRVVHDREFLPDESRARFNTRCPICSGMFLKSSLSAHIRTHTGERPHRCEVCGKAFGTKSNLSAHRWLHASRSAKPFKCTLCTRAYVRESDLQAHLRSHRNLRPFTCNECGMQFVRKHNFKRHVSEHSGVKRHPCPVCEKTFFRSYYLKEHLRTHSGLRPFVCHVCGKTSATKSNHNSHLKIHHAREPVNLEG